MKLPNFFFFLKNKLKHMLILVVLGLGIVPLITHADSMSMGTAGAAAVQSQAEAMVLYPVTYRFWVKVDSSWRYVNGTNYNFTTIMAVCPSDSSPVSTLPSNFYDGQVFNNQCTCNNTSCITSSPLTYYTKQNGSQSGTRKFGQSGVLCQKAIMSQVPQSSIVKASAPTAIPGVAKVIPTMLNTNSVITTDPNGNPYVYTWNDWPLGPGLIAAESNPIPGYSPTPTFSWVGTTGHSSNNANCP